MRKIFYLIFLIYSCSPDFSEINFSDLTFLENSIKVIEIIGGSEEDIVKKVVATNDGGFVLVGNTKSIDGYFEIKDRIGNDVFLIKFDLEGQIEWINTYGGSDDDVGNDVIETEDGKFYLIGYSKSSNGDASINKGQHDNWLIKIDSKGKLIWEKSYGFAGHDHAYNIIKTNDGGLFFNGFIDVTASQGEGGLLRHGVGEFWCHKVDMNGEIIWRRYFGGSNNDRSYDAIETSDGGFILVGTSESQDVEKTISFGSYDIWVIKISSSGNLIWEKSYGGSAIDEGVKIIKSQDDNYMIIGNTNSKIIEGVNTIGNNDFLMIKINSSGTLLNMFRHGSTEFDYAKDIIQTKDGSYFITGYSRNPKNIEGTSLKNNAVFLIQTQRSGIIQNAWELNGGNEDLGYSISQLNNGSIVLAGTTESIDSDFIDKKTTSKDIFIAILDK
tara:strand:+ start:10708 stop:12030 length:1323 start_codon:yes stop_codon:yes gene_type:complete